MSRWRRLGFSFLSALAADLIVAFFTLLKDNPHFNLVVLASMTSWFLLLVIPGWLTALPFVIFIDATRVQRLWFLAVAGFLIGPLLIFALAGYTEWQKPGATWSHGSLEFLYIATGISFLATAFYLTSVKLYSRRRIQPTT